MVDAPVSSTSERARGKSTIDPLVQEEPAPETEAVSGIERLDDGLIQSDTGADSLLDIQRQQPSDIDLIGMTVEGLEQTTIEDLDLTTMGASSLDVPEELTVSLTDDDTIELPSDPDPVLDQDLGFGPSLVQDAFPADPEPAPAPKSERGPLTLEDLENRVLDDPENPDAPGACRGLLRCRRDGPSGGGGWKLALQGTRIERHWGRAAEMADRSGGTGSDSVTYHQKRVELAYRTGDRGAAAGGIPLRLGDALGHSDAIDKALAVYGRANRPRSRQRQGSRSCEATGRARRLPAPAPAPYAPRPPPAKPEPPRAPTAPRSSPLHRVGSGVPLPIPPSRTPIQRLRPRLAPQPQLENLYRFWVDGPGR